MRYNTYMLHTSTFVPYVRCPRISGAAYAGDPHCVLQWSLVEERSPDFGTFIVLLRPKSENVEMGKME